MHCITFFIFLTPKLLHMKKFLRFLLVLIIILAAAFFIIGVIEPKDITVTRTALIKAPKEAVFEQITNFKNWTHWSPWYKMDTAMKLTYTGADGQPGSAYHWVGTDEGKTGEGDMKNMAVNGTAMDYLVTFTKPRRGEAQGVIKAEDTAGMTKVTWTMHMHMPYPMNAFLLFMNMDKMLGGDFENGLSNMKAYVESHATAPQPTVDVKEVDFPGHTYSGFRKTVAWNDMHNFFGESLGQLGKGLGPKINGPAAGLYYTWDTVNKNSDMVAAFPVADTTAKVKGAIYTVVAPSKAYMVVQKGPYSGMMASHAALGKKVSASGKKPSLVLEEYLVGPHEQKDSTQWVTNIYYLVN